MSDCLGSPLLVVLTGRSGNVVTSPMLKSGYSSRMSVSSLEKFLSRAFLTSGIANFLSLASLDALKWSVYYGDALLVAQCFPLHLKQCGVSVAESLQDS